MSDHAIVHIEIPAHAPAETSQFYEKVFGWEMVHHPEFNYTTFQTGPQQGGGFTEVGGATPEGYPKQDINSVLVYVSTDDIAGSLAKVEANGGKTLYAQHEIPGVGWFAIFEDPVGNRLALFTAAPPQAESAPNAETAGE
ncbi:MAG TPA: VOC family protein [Ktedonobacterales bacterium]